MIDTLRGTSEGEAEGRVLSPNKSGSESLIGKSRNIIFGVIMAMGASGCVTYGYYPSRPYYPERTNSYYDNGYRSGYYYNPPTHVIKAFPLRIERIDRGGHRGKHHR